MTRAIMYLLLAAAALNLSCSERSSADLQMPSEISARVSDSVIAYVWKGEVSNQDDFNAWRSRFARMFVDSMRTEDLDDRETIACAQVLHWSDRSSEAEKLLKPLTVGDGRTARRALRELVTLNIEEGRFEEAEHLIREYRRRFPPDPELNSGMHQCVDDIAMRFNNAGRPEESTRVILEELDHLPFDYPYSSFALYIDLFPLMTELGRLAELRKRTERYRARFEESLAAHLALPAPEDSTVEEYDKTTKSFESWIRYFGEVLGQMDMIGRKAPDLAFKHVYNADAGQTFGMMRGKVTLLNFWSTSYVACVIGYQDVGKLYSDYKDRGLEVVGLTNLLGYYHEEGGICPAGSEWDGSEEEARLSEEEETELIGSYIVRHGMVWPCGVSDKPLEDTCLLYTSDAAFIIIDRVGIIQHVHVGIGREGQVRRIIEKMLGEDVAWKAD